MNSIQKNLIKRCMLLLMCGFTMTFVSCSDDNIQPKDKEAKREADRELIELISSSEN